MIFGPGITHIGIQSGLSTKRIRTTWGHHGILSIRRLIIEDVINISDICDSVWQLHPH